MSGEQTFGSEANAFLPLSIGQLSVLCVTALKPMKRSAKRQKSFAAARSGVFAAPGSSLDLFKCGIRVQAGGDKKFVDVMAIGETGKWF